ncbi:MAG: hypothetical protein EBW87_00040 [Burkholderiaceae bacterium]|nr:hypothetical protein [Burkholderiaceae bacterium]
MRRFNLALNEPAELAISTAMGEVERLPADVRLTQAIVLLAQAKDLVSDFIDGQNFDQNTVTVTSDDGQPSGPPPTKPPGSN